MNRYKNQFKRKLRKNVLCLLTCYRFQNNHPEIGCEEYYVDGMEGIKYYFSKFSPDDQYIAVACTDSHLRVYNYKAKKISYDLVSPLNNPFTSLTWRPVNKNTSYIRNVVLTTDCEGNIMHWHVPSSNPYSNFDNFFRKGY